LLLVFLLTKELRMDDLQSKIKRLEARRQRLANGEKLTNHHWNGSDRCYECYCPKCDKHIMEACSEESVPFEAEAICYQCSRTPEEIEQEKLDVLKATVASACQRFKLVCDTQPELTREYLFNSGWNIGILLSTVFKNNEEPDDNPISR
jgi:hypothetical protein